jgi:membrane-associated protease RseP (regulator of RpoE activity)
MKKEAIIGICGIAFILMLIVSLFRSRDMRDSVENTLHEITTFDMWKQSAYTPAAYCPVNPQGGQGYYSPQAGAIRQAAMPGAPAIFPGQEKPALIKQFGVEVIPVGGGKVKITGVMGSSWADKAGLKAGDILLSFDTKRITGLEHFRSLVTKAAPERDYKVTFLRGGRTKSCLVTVGEGEMEGFTPIR